MKTERKEAERYFVQAYELYEKRDYQNAFHLFKKAADAGFIPSYVIIGDCYWNGYGMTADTTKAIQYYLAAELGDPDAMMRMADIYIRCNQPEKAIECYEKVAENGNAGALFNLGNLYFVGIGTVNRDFSKASAYLEKIYNNC